MSNLNHNKLNEKEHTDHSGSSSNASFRSGVEIIHRFGSHKRHLQMGMWVNTPY